MDNKKKAGVSVVVLLAVFAIGRYTAPEKIKIVEIEKKTQSTSKKTKKDDKQKTTKRKIVKPDGEVITEIIKERDKSETDTAKDKIIDEKKTDREETRGNNKINLSALAGFDVRTGKPIYGASITKSFIGPTTIGIWGLNNRSCGVTLGISF